MGEPPSSLELGVAERGVITSQVRPYLPWQTVQHSQNGVEEKVQQTSLDIAVRHVNHENVCRGARDLSFLHTETAIPIVATCLHRVACVSVGTALGLPCSSLWWLHTPLNQNRALVSALHLSFALDDPGGKNTPQQLK